MLILFATGSYSGSWTCTMPPFSTATRTRSSKPKVWIPHGPWCSRDDPYGWFPMTGSKLGRLSWIWVVMTSDVSVLGRKHECTFDWGGDYNETWIIFCSARFLHWRDHTDHTVPKYIVMGSIETWIFQVDICLQAVEETLCCFGFFKFDYSNSNCSQESEPTKIKEFCDRGSLGHEASKTRWKCQNIPHGSVWMLWNLRGILLNVWKGQTLT